MTATLRQITPLGNLEFARVGIIGGEELSWDEDPLDMFSQVGIVEVGIFPGGVSDQGIIGG